MEAKKHKEQREKAEAKAAAKESQAKETAASSDGAAKAPSKSSAVRAVLKGNRKMMAKDVVSALAAKGITVTEGLVYFVKGQLKGRKKKAQKEVAQVATAIATAPVMSDGDAVKTILKVKGWAAEIGGMKKLKALVEAFERVGLCSSSKENDMDASTPKERRTVSRFPKNESIRLRFETNEGDLSAYGARHLRFWHGHSDEAPVRARNLACGGAGRAKTMLFPRIEG